MSPEEKNSTLLRTMSQAAVKNYSVWKCMTLQQPEVMVDSFEGDFFWGEISLVTSFPAPLFDGSETNHPPRVRLIKRAKAMLKERLYSSCIMRKYYLGNGVTWKNSQIFFLLTFFLWSDFFRSWWRETLLKLEKCGVVTGYCGQQLVPLLQATTASLPRLSA